MSLVLLSIIAALLVALGCYARQLRKARKQNDELRDSATRLIERWAGAAHRSFAPVVRKCDFTMSSGPTDNRRNHPAFAVSRSILIKDGAAVNVVEFEVAWISPALPCVTVTHYDQNGHMSARIPHDIETFEGTVQAVVGMIFAFHAESIRSWGRSVLEQL